jgi:putative hydrolase of the HAD superfamily
MPNTSKIKLITFDAYNTLFKPRGSLSAQYVRTFEVVNVILYKLKYYFEKTRKKKPQVEEASKYDIKVTREQINLHFGQAYKQQLLKAPFYGLSLGMTPHGWWKEVNND